MGDAGEGWNITLDLDLSPQVSDSLVFAFLHSIFHLSLRDNHRFRSLGIGITRRHLGT